MTTPDARAAAADVASSLQSAGHVAWFAGGCVRDELLGLMPEDYDIATDAVPEQVLEVFPRARAVGVSFGVMLVHRHGFSMEVATFREEGEYSDHRRPDNVRFTNAQHDAMRRDFTINGLFRDPATGEVHDFVGGRADLEAGILRAIGDPEARFHEDHLRMLRAVRFVACLGVKLDPETEAAIAAHAGELSGVSRERIGEELRRLLQCSERAKGVALFERLGLGEAVFDTPSAASTFVRLEHVGREGGDLTAMLAAWSLDRGREHEDPDETAQLWRRSLLLSNEHRDGLRACLATHAALHRWDDMGVAAKKRLAASHWSAAALDMIEAIDPEQAARIRCDIAVLAETELSPARLLSGDALLADGMTPGAGFGEVLEQVYDAQLEGRVQTLSEALKLARELYTQ